MASPGSGGLFTFVQAQFDTLSPRDRKLLAGLIGFAGLVVVGFTTLTLRGWLDNKASRVVDLKESLGDLQDLQREHAEAAARIDAAEKRLEEFGDQPLSAYLEKTAAGIGVSDELSVSKQQTETVGGVQQTRYKVELQRAPYDLAMNFVYDIETSGYPLRIDSAQFKTIRYKGDKMLRLTLELTTFDLEETG